MKFNSQIPIKNRWSKASACSIHLCSVLLTNYSNRTSHYTFTFVVLLATNVIIKATSSETSIATKNPTGLLLK